MITFNSFISFAAIALCASSLHAQNLEAEPTWELQVHDLASTDSTGLVSVVRAASERYPMQASKILTAAYNRSSDQSEEHAMALVKAAVEGVTAAKLDTMQYLESYEAIFAAASEFSVGSQQVVYSDDSKGGLVEDAKSGLSGSAKGGLDDAKGGMGAAQSDPSAWNEALSQLANDTYSKLHSRMQAARLLSSWDVDRFAGTLPNEWNSGAGAGTAVSPFTP